jgi:hypothetical protein
MKCAVEMGPVVMVYTEFHKDWFRHCDVGVRVGEYSDTGWKSHKLTSGKSATNGKWRGIQNVNGSVLKKKKQGMLRLLFKR